MTSAVAYQGISPFYRLSSSVTDQKKRNVNLQYFCTVFEKNKMAVISSEPQVLTKPIHYSIIVFDRLALYA
jgi:hypothetical protein